MYISDRLKVKRLSLPTLLVNCTMNNTLASFISPYGKTLQTISCGHLKYKGTNKGSRVASQHLVTAIGAKILDNGYNKLIVKIKGFGKGRNVVLQELNKLGLFIVEIQNEDKITFNGCRVRKGKR